jgi:hypothetical protein
MDSAVTRSTYEQLFLESSDQKRTVDLKLGTVSIDYYEDVFSPTITAKIRIVNTGDSIGGADNQGGATNKKQSIYNGLPLRGGERLALKIKGNVKSNPGLDFATEVSDYLYVSSITDVISQDQRETFLLHLTSREAITNETSRVGKKYKLDSPISSSVEDILKNYLKTDKIGTIDQTQNKYGFIGNLRKPFTVLVWLASKAVPDSISKDATAGYFFYQTREGFQFRSLDKLIQQSSKATYTYTEVLQSSIDRTNDFTILDYSTEKNQNLLENLRIGAYSSLRLFFNPLNFSITDPSNSVFNIDNYKKGMKNLGREISPPPVKNASNIDLGHSPSRLITQVLDVGTLDAAISEDINSDPTSYQSQSLMRYNTLFTQTLQMTVPSNTNLHAGDIITCKFPKVSRADSSNFDQDQSGLYMIKELCHHFTPTGSYTSMKLIRDTFGLYDANNK